MKIALLTTDNREHQRTYGETTPRFGPAIEALLQGLATIAELEIHVIACTQRPMHAPEKLSDNTWFHLLHVPKIGWLRTATKVACGRSGASCESCNPISSMARERSGNAP